MYSWAVATRRYSSLMRCCVALRHSSKPTQCTCNRNLRSHTMLGDHTKSPCRCHLPKLVLQLIDHEGYAAVSSCTKYLAQVLRWYLYLVLISTKYFVKLVLVLVLKYFYSVLMTSLVIAIQIGPYWMYRVAQKVSHYRVSSLNRIKNRQSG